MVKVFLDFVFLDFSNPRTITTPATINAKMEFFAKVNVSDDELFRSFDSLFLGHVALAPTFKLSKGTPLSAPSLQVGHNFNSFKVVPSGRLMGCLPNLVRGGTCFKQFSQMNMVNAVG